MQFIITVSALFAAGALALPANLTPRYNYQPCSGLYNTAQCCATDVLGVADLDCANPPELPTDPSDFSAVCAGIGQRARCCVLPVLGQDVLCQTPAGVES